MDRNNRKFKIKEKRILRFAKEHWDNNPEARWNGRQIRNAFHTAVAMAEFDARAKGGTYNEQKDIEIKIGREQFEKIAHTVNEFDKYMRDTMKASYATKAAKEKMRAKASDSSKTEKESMNRKPKKKSKPKEDTDDSSHDESTREGVEGSSSSSSDSESD